MKIQEGFFIDQEYDGYAMMKATIKNLKQLCPYQLRPDSLSGRMQILQLHSMQIVFGKRQGGTMHNAGAPKDALNIAIVESSEGTACFGRIKIKTGDIFFFDDSQPHNFIANETVKFIVVSIPKSDLGSQLSKFTELLEHRIYDTDTYLVTLLREIWEDFTTISTNKNRESYEKAEAQILSAVLALLEEQTPVIPKLTKGEKAALAIRDQVIQHLDGNVSIGSLAKEHHISMQTLQNSFKSLFGFTPKKFLRQLKLNLVHHELQNGTPEQTSVSVVANKWGFVHMSRFSTYYTELFGVYPSQTLKIPEQYQDDRAEICVNRKEMM